MSRDPELVLLPRPYLEGPAPAPQFDAIRFIDRAGVRLSIIWPDKVVHVDLEPDPFQLRGEGQLLESVATRIREAIEDGTAAAGRRLASLAQPEALERFHAATRGVLPALAAQLARARRDYAERGW